MKLKALYLGLAAMYAAAPLAAAENGYDYTMGTYNVRIATDTEPGKIWSDRKENVARTITDTGFDVVGLTEVLDGEQRTDLQALLPDYDSDFRLVYSSSSKKQMNAVLWRRDRFEALENGMFYLSPDINSSSIKFTGASQSRATVWAKLRDVNTDEIFYFFCCHMNRHEHYIAQLEGSRVVARMIREIAGEYPAFLVGDLNSLPGEHQVAGMIGTVMTSAQEISATPVTEPLITINFWTDDPNNKYQFDYVYVKHVDVDRCFTVKETYGQSFNPSDHLPLAITCRLTAPESRRPDKVYVPAGASINEAVETAAPGATVYLEAGEYTLPEGGLKLDKSVTLEGGYDGAFTNISGYSTLLASDGSRAIEVLGSNFLEMRRCKVSGGETEGNGGAVLCHGWMLDASDCSFDGNSASHGAAIFAEGDLRLTRCGFSGNTAADGGAALYWAGGTRAFITDCSAASNDGGNGSVISFASPSGAATVTAVNCSVFDNKGGILSTLTSDSKVNIINCTITANEADAAVNTAGGDLNIHNSLVLANSALDVTGAAKITSAYNVYTSASDINFTAGKNDITGTDRESALSEAAALFGEKEDCGTTALLPIASPDFAGKTVNALPNRELNEYAIATDLDNDFRTTTFTYLTHDQRGDVRPTDGTATRGACEYLANNGADIVAIPDNGILDDCRIIDLAGRTVATPGTITVQEAKSLSGIAPGIYILVWRGGALKIKY